MVVNALLMNLADNVVTTVTEIAKGDNVCFMKGNEHMILKAEENIPYCHKVALEPYRCSYQQGMLGKRS